jgi:hypothetical protein
VGGLPWLNPADVCGAKPQGDKKKKKENNNNNFLVTCDLVELRGAACAQEETNFFYKLLLLFFCLFAGDLAELRGATSAQEENQKNKLKKFNIFLPPPRGLTPRTSADLSHGSPPTSYLLTPTSYLYYYIRFLMSLISLFFFVLTFGKPLNYFTCEKEDF